MRIERLGAAIGAEVTGVDLAAAPRAHAAALRAALLEHQVLAVRDQALDPAALAGLGRTLGPLNRHPYVTPLAGHPDVFAIVKEPEDRHHFGNGWHTDLAYAERPALATLLHAVEIPPAGGDTVFASLSRALEALSPALRAVLRSLRVVHTNALTYGAGARRFRDGRPRSMRVAQAPEAAEVAHPLVRVHPETRREGLYLSPVHALRIDGMTEAESRPLLDFLAAHATAPEHTVRVRWRPGTLVLWDNRCTVHYAVDDFAGHRRVMHRVTLEGDRPLGPASEAAA